MELRNTDIRRIVLAEHDELRKRLREIDAGLEVLSRGLRATMTTLPATLNAFYDEFIAHITHEQMILQPVLAGLDAWGEARSNHMDAEHTLQRAEIEKLRALPPTSASFEADVRAFIEHVKTDMAEEEKHFLNERILRDDIVVLDTFGG